MKTKRLIQTPADVLHFLVDCGFVWVTLGGCYEYHKPIPNEYDYVFQINDEGFEDIKSLNTPIIFTENGRDPSTHPLSRYEKSYPSLKEFVEAENERVDFSQGLSKWYFFEFKE